MAFIHSGRLRPIAALVAVCLLLGASSCKKKDFTIEGTINGASEAALILEKSDFTGRWIVVDSTRTGKSGKFSLKQQAPAAPEVYRLRMADRFVYFPVEGTETVRLTTTESAFGSDYTLEGSEQAADMARFEKMFAALHTDNPDSVESFKRNVYAQFMHDARGSVLSFFILTRMIDENTPLFDSRQTGDLKYFTAVATAYHEFRPDDPRTDVLEKTALQRMRDRNAAEGRENLLEAEMGRLIEISLDDPDGKTCSLSEITAKGRPTILVFAPLTHEQSPELNRDIAALRNSRGGNIEIYQVCADPDRYTWRDAAKNLPWTVVFDPMGVNSENMLHYNVTHLPTFFIFDSHGELIDRAETISDLRQKLATV